MSGLGRLIGRSSIADVFVWEGNRVVKLFRPGIPAEVAERELDRTRAVRRLGVSTPEAFETVTADARAGLVMESLEGPTMLETLVAAPQRAGELARALADLQADLHRRPAGDLPPQREHLLRRIGRAKGVSAAAIAAARERLESLPDDDALCHGDLHPQNVVLTEQGPVALGWLDACRGNPLGDVARTALGLDYGILPNDGAAALNQPFGELREAFCADYLERYAERRGVTVRAVTDWRLPVAVGRLAELLAVTEYNRLGALVRELVAS